MKLVLAMSLCEVVECLLSVQFFRRETRTGPCVLLKCSLRLMVLNEALKRGERALNKQKERSGEVIGLEYSFRAHLGLMKLAVNKCFM